MSVRAMVSICCSPPDRKPPCRVVSFCRVGNRSKTRSMVLAPFPRCATSRFSHTVRSAKIRRSSGTNPMPARATRNASQPVMSVPLNATRPECGGVRPMIDRMVVDLPTPLRPSRHTHSPAWTSMVTPKSTRDSPYAVWISLTSSNGALNADLRSMPLSEIDATHLGIRADVGGGAVGDDPPLVQHRDLLRDREDHLHVVLGEQEREPAR